MVTDRFIQICPSRTGSSSIKVLLYELADAGEIVMIDRVPHTSYETNVARYREAGYDGDIPPAVCSVRNPWDWYVSKWWFGLERSKALGFRPTFREHMEQVRDGFGDWNHGTCTNAWNHIGGDYADYVRRYEDFEAEAIRVWSAVMPDLVDKNRWQIRLRELGRFEAGKGNTGLPHSGYQDYYDAELRSWVEEWDREYIQRWGYKFEGVEL